MVIGVGCWALWVVSDPPCDARQKLGAGSVREAGGTRAGEAIEPMT